MINASFIHSFIEQILLYCPLHTGVVVYMVKKTSTNFPFTELSLEGTRTSNQADTVLRCQGYIYRGSTGCYGSI